jgi:hypothetical protein
VFRIVQEIEDSTEVGRVCWEERVKEWEKGQVAFVADMIRFI